MASASRHLPLCAFILTTLLAATAAAATAADIEDATEWRRGTYAVFSCNMAEYSYTVTVPNSPVLRGSFAASLPPSAGALHLAVASGNDTVLGAYDELSVSLQAHGLLGSVRYHGEVDAFVLTRHYPGRASPELQLPALFLGKDSPESGQDDSIPPWSTLSWGGNAMVRGATGGSPRAWSAAHGARDVSQTVVSSLSHGRVCHALSVFVPSCL